jgi:Fe-S-cluster containining protein
MSATPAEVFQVYREERNMMERWYPKALVVRGKKPVCRQGCAHCCVYDQPPLTMLEATALVHYCKTTPGFEDVLVAAEKAGEAIVQQTEESGQKWMERTNPLQVCPFLDREKGACRIYSLRPTACVFAYSEDVQKCVSNVGTDKLVGWHVGMDEQAKTMDRLMRLLPGDARQKFDRLLKIRQHNNTGVLMLSVAMAVVLRPDLRERLVKVLQRGAATT